MMVKFCFYFTSHCEITGRYIAVTLSSLTAQYILLLVTNRDVFS